MGYGYQADQAMAIALGSPGGVVPVADMPKVAAGLAVDIAARGGHLSTGIFGTKALLPALSSTGHGGVAMHGTLGFEHTTVICFEEWYCQVRMMGHPINFPSSNLTILRSTSLFWD
jgi:hypothetical protein